MNDEDKQEFADILNNMTSALGRKPMTGGAKAMWWDVMAGLTLDQFRASVMRYLATSTDWPAPATILEVAGINQFPTPEQAWNLTPKSETESGWLCEQTAAALGACQDSLDRGDLIGARMAFIEVYKQLPKEGKPKWWISEGAWMTYEERLEQKQKLLMQHPTRRPELIQPTELQRLTHSGSQRTGGGLQRLSDLSESTDPGKKLLQS